MRKVELIDNNALLNECVQHLSSCSEIAFDLEFDNNRYKYGFTLCLIQLATPSRCFVIDPLKKLDFTGLFEIMQNESILKIAHSPDQDLRLFHLLGCFPKNIFDTEIAIKLLDYEFTGLGKTIEHHFGLAIDKKLQTSNWHLRPLTAEQIEYAANDVLYLHQLKEILHKQAEDKGIVQWLDEENNALSTVIYENTSADLLKKEDKKYLSPFGQYVLLQMLLFRDKLGQEMEKPSAQLISNELIRDIAAGNVKIGNWVNLRGINWEIKTESFKKELRDVYQKAVESAQNQGLSAVMEKPKLLSTAERLALEQQRTLEETVKEQLFKPIQNRLVETYGVNATKFLLGEGTINHLIKKHLKISEVKMAYKRNLIRSLANELDIDLEEYW